MRSEFYFNGISPVLDLRMDSRGARTKVELQVRGIS